MLKLSDQIPLLPYSTENRSIVLADFDLVQQVQKVEQSTACPLPSPPPPPPPMNEIDLVQNVTTGA